MYPEGANITSWAAVTSLAQTASQNGFFLRAGQSHLRRSPFIDALGERVQMSYVPYLPQDLFGVNRMAMLAGAALRQIPECDGTSVRLAVAVPERFAIGLMSNDLNGDGLSFAEKFDEQARTRFPHARIDYFPSGRAGGVLAMQRVREWLKDDPLGLYVAGGVDSYYDWDVLEVLKKHDRVLSEDNIDGFVPGEGAAFVAFSEVCGRRAIAQLSLCGIGYEQAPLISGKFSRCSGMTNALNAASAGFRIDGKQSKYWLVDLTHEMYGIREFQTVIARFGYLMGQNASLDTPLREVGNLGAATLPLFVTLACEAWQGAYAPDTTCIALASSDNGLRGALVLEEAR